jgi:hypothetical protein
LHLATVSDHELAAWSLKKEQVGAVDTNRARLRTDAPASPGQLPGCTLFG